MSMFRMSHQNRLAASGRYSLPQGLPVLTLLIGLLLGQSAVQAQTNNYWDTDLTTGTPIKGGAGTWNGTNNNWTDSTSSSQGFWPGGASVANFGGTTGGTVTVSTGLSIGGLNFLTNGYTLIGSSLTGMATTNTLNAGSGISATVGSVLAGSGKAFSKDGAGTITLGGTNTYTGATTVNAGTLALSNTGYLNGTSSISIASGATLEINASTSRQPTGTTTFSGEGTLRVTGSGTYSAVWCSASPTFAFSAGAWIDVQSGSLVGSCAERSVWTDNKSGLNIASGARFDGVEGIINVDAVTGSGSLWYGVNRISGSPSLTMGVANGSGTFSGVIQMSSGGTSVPLIKTGTGTQTFSGNNTYPGTTSVNAGSLYINGNQSAATGAVSVASGATLGGSGTIGGATTVSSAGTLDPGAAASTVGTLTMSNNLTLSSGSVTNFQLAQAGTAGGSCNDLITVNGNLTLSGTLNVTAADGTTGCGSGIGAGLYTLFKVTGNVGGNYAAINLPSSIVSAGLTGQVYVASGEVRLLIYSPTAPYWDTGATIDNKVDGGTGTWSSTSTNWTNFAGSTKNAWLNDGSVATFSATGGAVTVSGAITMGGLSFQTNGYSLSGGTLRGVAANNVLSADDGVSASIATPLTGIQIFSKDGAGTITLGETNTYTGATVVNAGTLVLSNSGYLNGTPSISIATGATLAVNAATGSRQPTAGAVTFSGTGTLAKTGAGAVTWCSSAPTFALSAGALIDVQAGTLTASCASLGVWTNNQSGLNIASGATFNTAEGAVNVDAVTGQGSLTYGWNGATLSVGVANGSGTFEGVIGSLTANPTLRKKGTGTQIFTGNNTYTGPTALDAGSLYINGNQSAATGAVSVASGATLGGSGTIGGATTVSSAGTLDPGAASNTVGTMTIGTTSTRQSLAISTGASTNFQLAQAGTNGGSCNDLVTVNGNLTLGGTIKISKADGATGCAGNFGTGTYRLFNYTGTLTNNLTASSLDLPSGYQGVIDTSVQGQVNLVITGVNYWDGSNATSNGVVDGGSGTWNSTNTNWADAGDVLHNVWPGGATAMFKGAAGAVTVVGNQTVTGLNFNTSGYTLTGGTLIGIGQSNLIHTEGASNVTTIASVLAGSSANNAYGKTGAGTLIFTGANTYTGSTGVYLGTLQIGNGGSSGDLVSTSVSLSSGATLAFKRSDAYAFASVVSGDGQLVQSGSGTTSLSGANDYKGATTVSAGQLNINGNQASATGALSVASGAALGGSGTVGGATTLASGATLAPGATVGTLSFVQSLTLSSGANSVFDLAQAGTPGGGCNDRVAVTGSLVLAGTLTVNKADGTSGCSSTFGDGVYRLFDYTGGTVSGAYSSVVMPAGYAGVVDTTTAGQVNLTVSSTNYWDGSSTSSNGTVDGGAGTWGAATTNWTNSIGAYNNTWGGGTMVANFQGTSGAVTVSGAQSVGGLNFNVGGYTLSAGSITGAASTNPILVSKGIATLNSVLTGSNAFSKTGAGTLVLGGVNTYTGATTVSLGTLQTTANGALPSASSVTVDSGATLNLNGTTQSVTRLNSSGTLALGSNGQITLTSGASTSGAVTGSGKIVVGPGASLTLTQALLNSGISIELAGGTLNLGAGLTHSLGTLSVTSAGAVIDFGAGASSTQVTFSTLTPGTGSALTVNNWTHNVDLFKATTVTGSPAVGTPGVAPLNQITFNGYASSSTTWMASQEVTPVTSDVPQVQIKLVTKGGTGSFTYNLTGLSASSVSVSSQSADVAVSSSVLTGTVGTAVQISQVAPSSWPAEPLSVSCIDNAGAISGNGSGELTSWSSGSTVSLPISKLVLKASIVCTFTNAQYRTVTGQVFNDGGAPTSSVNTGTPNDGLQNGSEAGVSGVIVNLTNCAGTTYSTASTDGSGNYSLSVPAAQAGQTVCVSPVLSSAVLATGANASGTVTPDGSATTVSGVGFTYSRSANQQSFIAPTAGSVTLNFGQVPVSTLIGGGTMSGLVGNYATYAHRFTAGTGGSLKLSSGAPTANPSTVTGWGEALYLDSGCTGIYQSSSPLISSSITVVQGQEVCFVMREFVPSTAAAGSTNSVPVKADLTLVGASPALLASYSVIDVTTASTSAVELIKRVRNITADGPSAFWKSTNSAQSGDVLEYIITFTNKGSSPVSNLTIQDATTAWTTWTSTTYDTLPSGMTCTVNTPANPSPAAAVACSPAVTGNAKGNLTWTMDGTLQPGAYGAVTFKVTVD